MRTRILFPSDQRFQVMDDQLILRLLRVAVGCGGRGLRRREEPGEAASGPGLAGSKADAGVGLASASGALIEEGAVDLGDHDGVVLEEGGVERGEGELVEIGLGERAGIYLLERVELGRM